MVADGLTRVLAYVPTTKMLADSLTKPLRKEFHKDHWLHLHVTDPVPHDDAAHQLLIAMAQAADPPHKKRKWPCVDCGNLFPTQTALKRHMLNKEARALTRASLTESRPESTPVLSGSISPLPR